MPFPLGVSVVARTTPPAQGVPTATDTWFVAGLTDAGDLNVAKQCRDLAQFEAEFATRTAGNIALWDAMDVFFREGGRNAYVSRGATGAIDDCLGAFHDGLGPGQVSAVGFPLAVDGATIGEVADYCEASAGFRVAVNDVPEGEFDLADLTTYAETVTDPLNGYSAIFSPWVTVPGPSGVTGVSERTVPASPVIAALCARVDSTGNPNQAAAGRWLPLQYVSALTNDMPMADRATLLDAGVNSMAEVYGVLENYGFQTLVAQTDENPFWQFNCSRMRMAMIGQSRAIGEEFMFRPIDGKGGLAGSFAGSLNSMLLDYFNANALFGETPSEAFRVDVSESVNTIGSIAQGTLRAIVTARLTLAAKAVEIELVSVPVGGTV